MYPLPAGAVLALLITRALSDLAFTSDASLS
jgi:hypothetical protein